MTGESLRAAMEREAKRRYLLESVSDVWVEGAEWMAGRCPFCGEDDLDLIGLKGHLLADCTGFAAVVAPIRIFT